MTVRYYAAAQAAAGVAEEPLEAPDGASLADALEAALAVDRSQAPSGTGSGATIATRTTAPPLAEVLRRCTFLVNEIAAKDRSRVLEQGDVVDVLPPFAGG
ncbi:MoaD/ThiS family protein [Sinomonas notoginsengisoli]|uniref:MoaD/ThiS family protein n=1 Tax=Sinomonas notoginsengisoli TaxID=1457311 RepID=UPI001F1FA385|nr:MoaD/ThiS family protein [Sinomonas notoginsengisoli]